MTGGTGPLQYASHSGILSCMPLHCVPGARLILSSAAASRAAPIESPFNRPSILFRHASLCAGCLPWPVLRHRHPGQPSLRPPCSKSALRRRVLATVFPISTSPGSRGTISAGLCIPTSMSNALSLPSGDHGVARISSILPASHISDSGTLLPWSPVPAR